MRAIDSILRFILFGLILGALAPTPAHSAEPCAYIKDDVLVECELTVNKVREIPIAELQKRFESVGLAPPDAIELLELANGQRDLIERTLINIDVVTSVIPPMIKVSRATVVWDDVRFNVEHNQEDMLSWVHITMAALVLGAAAVSVVSARVVVWPRPLFVGVVAGATSGLALGNTLSYGGTLIPAIIAIVAAAFIGLFAAVVAGKRADSDAAAGSGAAAGLLVGLLSGGFSAASAEIQWQWIALCVLLLAFEVIGASLRKRFRQPRGEKALS